MVRQGALVLGLAVLAVLGGCAVGPDYQPPDVTVPALFGSPSREIVTQDTAPQPEAVRWWRTLHDRELNRLIERAIACNPDIEIAITRMQAVRTQQIVVLGRALPTVGASGTVAAGSGTNLTDGRVAQSIRAGADRTGLESISRMAGFDANWELDIWGKYQRLLEAVRDDAEALAELKNAVLISVVADVARYYVDVRTAQRRLQIAQAAVRELQKNVDFVQDRFNQGIVNELDLTLAKRELADAQATVPVYVAAVAASENQIALLLGTYSADVVPELRIPTGIPLGPTRLRTGVPADLLRRRPDVRGAERALAAATARIGVATADLFPTVTFTAGIGVQGGTPNGSGQHPISNPIWSAGPGAYWPLLDFGRLDALIDIQQLQTHALLVAYRQTILLAVEEVDTAIKQYRAQQQRLRELAIAVQQARRAVVLALQRYERGLTDFLNVVDAERQEFAIEDQYAVAQEAAAVQYIALYKALGGGWELYEEIPPLPDAQPAVLATVRRLTNDWH